MINTQQMAGVEGYVRENADRLTDAFGNRYLAVTDTDGVYMVVDSDNSWGALLRRTMHHNHLVIGTVKQFTRKPTGNVFAEERETMEVTA